MAITFSSTSFLLQKWSNNADKKLSNMRRIELDIVEDKSTREVCRGSNCSLFYDNKSNEYMTMGNCKKNILCTQTKMIKDSLFLTTGVHSITNESMNFSEQLSNWK